MAKKFLIDLDLAKNNINNARIQNLGAAPSSPVTGQIYYDTSLVAFGVYNGSSWSYMGVGTGDASTNTSSSVDSEVALFSGTGGKTLKRATGSGLAKLTSGVLSIASSGSDYAPATATTSALKGDGSGGFSAATLTDVGAPTADYSLNSHKLTSVSDPTSAQDAATKAYVDLIAQGYVGKTAVRVASTANVTVSSPGTSTFDGVTLSNGDLILLKNQTTGSENGLYVFNGSGSALTRSTPFDTSAEVKPGLFVFVSEGTANGDNGFALTTDDPITLGSTTLTFTQTTGAGQITAGTGLSKSGNTLSLENSGVLTVAHGGTGAATLTGLVKGNGTSAFTAAASGTDYAPATSGSSVLKGDGAGGFSSAKYTATIGDGSTTAIAVTHSLGTKDVIAQVRDASTDAVVECDITQTSTSVTTFTFAAAPATNAYKVVIIG